MTSKEFFVFSQRDSVPCSHTMFYDLKKKGELIDVSIKIDNGMYAAHRVVLAAAVPYFRTMFTSNLAECTEKEVTVKGVDPVALECLMDFAYTNVIEITAENVQSLLVASDYLQMTEVRDSCCDFLSKRLNPNNVMNVRTLADSLNCVSLLKNADSYIRKNFDAFSQTKEFLNLSFAFLNELIRKHDLRVSSEEKVFDAVMNWVKADAERQKKLRDLLTGVRMTLLSGQFLVKKASKEKLIMESVPCRNILDEAKNYFLLPEECPSAFSFTVSERCYEQRPGGGIYLFCCSETNGLTVFKYTDDTMKWNTVLNDKSRCDLRHVLAVDDEIYVLRRNVFETFNPRTLAWTLRAKFPIKYLSFKTVVPYKGRIYCFGSEDPYAGIYFDIQQNQWIDYFHPNLKIFYDDDLVPSGNSVYIFVSRLWLPYRIRPGQDVLKYTIETEDVSRLPKMETERSDFGSAVIGDTVYVCGGLDNSNNSASTERKTVLRSTQIYSSSLGWRRTCPMNKPRKNFALLAYNKKLYAIGGTTKGTRDLVEVYDPKRDKWTLIGGSLDGQCDFVKAVAISDEN